MYKPRKGGEEKMGKSRRGDRVDLEFNLEIIKKILDDSEDQLKRKRGNYGQLANNGKLTLVRAIGNPEAVAGNYFKKYAGGKEPEVKRLKEVNLVNTVVKLMTGESVGFPCVEVGNGQRFDAEGLFDECRSDAWGEKDKFKVKSVLKSVVPNFKQYKVPKKNLPNRGDRQADASKNGSQIYNDDFDKSKVINEKCEPNRSGGEFTDGEKDIRQEVCGHELLIRSGNLIVGFRFLFLVFKFKNNLKSLYINEGAGPLI